MGGRTHAPPLPFTQPWDAGPRAGLIRYWTRRSKTARKLELVMHRPAEKRGPTCRGCSKDSPRSSWEVRAPRPSAYLKGQFCRDV